jgi:hypothetical protein
LYVCDIYYIYIICAITITSAVSSSCRFESFCSGLHFGPKDSLSYSHRMGLLVRSSLSFYLSGSVLISLFLLNSFASSRIYGWHFSQHFQHVIPLRLTSMGFYWEIGINQSRASYPWGITLLLIFSVFSKVFEHLGVEFSVILLVFHQASWICTFISVINMENFWLLLISNNLFVPFSFFSLSGTTNISTVVF